ncbi:MAG: MFS transporter [Rickettsiaceae bacterium]|nr:MFS transporter [Rickettsiaceae bacterium]
MKPINLTITTSCVIIQYFGYAIFSLASIPIADSYFPGTTQAAKLSYFFATLSITSLAKPLGSFIFGYIGDAFGRKLSILLSSLLASCGCIIIYFIPFFSEIGIYATILVVIARFIFLAGVIGEVDGIRVYFYENLTKSHRNLASGAVILSTQIGAFLASISLSYIFHSKETVCISFLIIGVAGMAFGAMQANLPESEQYRHDKSVIGDHRITYIQLLVGQTNTIILSSLVIGASSAIYIFYIIILPPYLKLYLALDVTKIVPVLIFIYGVSALISGFLADKIGAFNVLAYGIFLSLLNLLAVSYCIGAGYFASVQGLMMAGCAIAPAVSLTSFVIVKDNINTLIRLRIFSISHSLGGILISSPLGFTSVYIANRFGAEYISAELLIITIIAAYSIVKISSNTKSQIK